MYGFNEAFNNIVKSYLKYGYESMSAIFSGCSEGGITSLVLYFLQFRTTWDIVQYCGLLCQWVLYIHLNVES